MGKIYYLIPDLHKRDFSFVGFYRAIRDGEFRHFLRHKIFVQHKPVGGVKVMYQHCLMLKNLGYNAYPLAMGDYEGNFFGYDVEIKHIREVGYALSSNDIIVSPEYLPYLGLNFQGCKRVLFNQSQSWRYHENRLKPEDKGKNFLELGYDYVINCSQHLCNMLKLEMSMKSYPVTNGIDSKKFFPEPEKRVVGRILALSRKHPEELSKIKALAKGLDFHFKVVDGLTEDELIEEYKQADIFLATGYPEGLPLPQLEAMNCGCVVVGFTGGGGNEYMIDQNTALVAQDGDCESVVKRLAQIERNETLKERIRKQGMEKAATYTLENTENMLNDFFKHVVKV